MSLVLLRVLGLCQHSPVDADATTVRVPSTASRLKYLSSPADAEEPPILGADKLPSQLPLHSHPIGN